MEMFALDLIIGLFVKLEFSIPPKNIPIPMLSIVNQNIILFVGFHFLYICDQNFTIYEHGLLYFIKFLFSRHYKK